MQRLSENSADGHFSSLVKNRHFKFGKRPRLDYGKYLVGDSINRLMNSRRLSKSARFNYRWYVYHLCEEIGLTTEDIVKIYSRQGQYSHEFHEIVSRHIIKLAEDEEKGLTEAQKVAGARSAIKKFSILIISILIGILSMSMSLI